MLKEEFEELIKREVNENQYKNIETAYEALPEYMDKMYLASAISNDIGKAINVLSFLGSYISELMGSIIIERQKLESKRDCRAINRREGNSGIHSKRRAAIVGTR